MSKPVKFIVNGAPFRNPTNPNKLLESGLAITPPFCPITISEYPLLSVFVIHNRTCLEFSIDDTSKHVVPSTVCPAIESEKIIFLIFCLCNVVPKNSVEGEFASSLFLKVTFCHIAYIVTSNELALYANPAV